jgi:hypothetical protein
VTVRIEMCFGGFGLWAYEGKFKVKAAQARQGRPLDAPTTSSVV